MDDFWTMDDFCINENVSENNAEKLAVVQMGKNLTSSKRPLMNDASAPLTVDDFEPVGKKQKNSEANSENLFSDLDLSDGNFDEDISAMFDQQQDVFDYENNKFRSVTPPPQKYSFQPTLTQFIEIPQQETKKTQNILVNFKIKTKN